MEECKYIKDIFLKIRSLDVETDKKERILSHILLHDKAEIDSKDLDSVISKIMQNNNLIENQNLSENVTNLLNLNSVLFHIWNEIESFSEEIDKIGLLTNEKED